jgi:hypothetical protein
MREANTHSTFDVYSVGKMLSTIITDYFSDSDGNPKWMEVIEKWRQIICKMTWLIPSKRITMDKALEEVREIRHFLFGHS